MKASVVGLPLIRENGPRQLLRTHILYSVGKEAVTDSAGI